MFDYENVNEVPKTLAGFFSELDLEGKNRVEVSYSYPVGPLLIHELGVVGRYDLSLLSVEVDGRVGIKVVAVYKVELKEDEDLHRDS